MKLTNNFSLHEFLISDFYKEDIDQLNVLKEALRDTQVCANIQTLAENLQVLRDHTGKRIDINIAFRPKWWELRKGRSGGSKHVLGMAADIVVDGMHPHEVHKTIEKLISEGKMKPGGLGKYDSFTHYDIRGTIARW